MTSRYRPLRQRCAHTIIILLLLLSVSSPAWAERHALLIGISQYTAGGAQNLHDLPGTQNDIALIESVLQSRLGFTPDRIQVLRDAEATHRNIEQAFRSLAQQVQPGDFVYIHYSGHGSYLPDAGGHKRDGAYQTVVSYGARAPGRAESDLDRFDVLDDELNQWLKPIDERAGELIYVADSCHAATNTRGTQALVTRAAPLDDQPNHPRRGQVETPYQFRNAALIYAARADQSAHEFKTDDQQPHGVFTWHWAQALQSVRAGETWAQVFTRAADGVSRTHGNSQHPQSEGPALGRAILGGTVDPRPAVMVREVRAPREGAGTTVTLDAGRLSGVNPGSRFASTGEVPAELEITQSFATWSEARVLQGTVQRGDFLTETARAYVTGPLKLFFLASPALLDSPLGTRLQALFPATSATENRSGYEWVSDQSQADLVVALLRPQRCDGVSSNQTVASPPALVSQICDAESKLLYSIGPKGRNSLPDETEDSPPEVWVLTPGERLLHDAFRIGMADPDAGLAALRENLTKYRQIRALSQLTQDSGGSGSVDIGLIAYDRCPEFDPQCIRLSEDEALGYRRRPDTLPFDSLRTHTWSAGDLLSFAFQNRGRRERYVYVLDVSPSGAIEVVFPARGMLADSARLKPEEQLSLHDEQIAVLLDTSGTHGQLILITESQINPYLLEQDGYQRTTRGTSTGTDNPLEQLLSANLDGVRAAASFNTGSWYSQWLSFEVNKDPAVAAP